MAQVRIVSLPFLKRGIAHVEWGPIWCRRGELPDPKIFAAMLNVLREEYSARRKLLLRIVPKFPNDVGVELEGMIIETGFKKDSNARHYRTIIKDISSPLQEIRKSFEKDWRYYLGRAERNSLEIRQETSPALYKEFLPVYRDLLNRKGLTPAIDIDRWIRLQEIIPEEEKPHIFMVYHQDLAVAGLVVSSLGDTGFPIIAASNDAGLKFCASYLMHWRVIEWLKENGCSFYDLGGIDQEKNPGTYHFKKGFKGREVSFLGQFEHCTNPLSRILARVGDPVREWAKKIIKPKDPSPKE